MKLFSLYIENNLIFEETFEMHCSKIRLWLPVVAVAVVVRVCAAVTLATSPLRNFHLVPGLDMQRMLENGEWGTRIDPLLTCYRALVALLWWLNGYQHQVYQLFAIQLLLGVLVALLTAWITLKLLGRASWAGLAGCVVALYGPALMYECTTLQESVVTFSCLLAISSLFWAHKNRWRPPFSIVCGVLWGVASIGRPTTLLLVLGAVAWYWRNLKHHRLRRYWWCMPTGVLTVWILVGAFNGYYSRNISPFFNVLPYSISVNTDNSPNPSTVAKSSKLQSLTRIGLNAIKRLPVLFLANEVPDNLNYYFIREKFLPLRICLGPWLVLPLAGAGMILMLGSGRWKRREGLLLGTVMLLMLPCCANYPLGRYRLILYPYLCLLAIYPFWWVLRYGERRSLRRGIVVLVVVLVVAGLNLAFSTRPFLRGCDFVAWALAMEAGGKNVTEDSVEVLEEGLEFSGYSERAALVNLMVRLIPAGQLDRANQILQKSLEAGNIKPSFIWYYAGLARLRAGNFRETIACLKRCDSDQLGALASKRSFFEGEAYRMLKDIQSAKASYQRALQENPSAELQTQIEKNLLAI